MSVRNLEWDLAFTKELQVYYCMLRDDCFIAAWNWKNWKLPVYLACSKNLKKLPFSRIELYDFYIAAKLPLFLFELQLLMGRFANALFQDSSLLPAPTEGYRNRCLSSKCLHTAARRSLTLSVWQSGYINRRWQAALQCIIRKLYKFFRIHVHITFLCVTVATNSNLNKFF